MIQISGIITIDITSRGKEALTLFEPSHVFGTLNLVQ
jgi:hypothetical protein